jgi:predicted lipoprotein with Yx(FWY)xxD motif
MDKAKLFIVSVLLIGLLSACAGNATQVPASTQVPAYTQSTSTESPAPATTQTAVIPSTGGIDWTQHGFSKVLASQQFTPGTALTIDANPYTIQVPADAFSETVTIQVLSGDPANFKSNAPAGEQPVLAFALNVTNSQDQFVQMFTNPITLTINTADIVPNSMYYNVSVDGTYTPNSKGLQVTSGKLIHPIAGTPVAWVITSPVSNSTPSASSQGYPLNIASNPTLGKILVDSQGMTLYTFKNDTSGKSNCTGGCATLWPPLTVTNGASPTAAPGITGTLGVIKRADGSQQVTYNGAPLYTFSGDTKPGDTTGQGFKQLWYVVPVSGNSSSGSSNGKGGRGGY